MGQNRNHISQRNIQIYITVSFDEYILSLLSTELLSSYNIFYIDLRVWLPDFHFETFGSYVFIPHLSTEKNSFNDKLFDY